MAPVTTKTFLAPAKINLCLHVLGRRANGYHDLAMLMQRVTLYDRITMTLRDQDGLRVSCAGVELPPGQENIAARAVRALLELTERRQGLEIDIDKQIPVAAGLGGGSSDAATVLMGLNEMLDLGLTPRQLMDVGVKLGADVPFFIFRTTAWATGIGEELAAVPAVPQAWYVLVNPGLQVSTAWVYQNLRLTSPRSDLKIPRFSGELGELLELLHNDLEQVTMAHFPLIGDIKQRLRNLGAEGALMSGSGPTVFGVFREERTARAAAEALAAEPGWRAFAVAAVDDECTL
jgi:4-diphosphocytidyl-2-C-methyl-D-erythritol kinase